MRGTMPRVSIENLMGEVRQYAELITKPDGTIRAGKPDPRKSAMYARAAYVWRMVVFQVSPNPRHQCMPCTADFDLHDEDWHNRDEVTKHLDTIANSIVDSIPKNQWHGIQRWGQVFGLVGRPVVRQNGTVVYR